MSYINIGRISSPQWHATSYDIVYHWERIISQKLNIPIYKQSKILSWVYRQIELRLRMVSLYNFLLLKYRKLTLMFVMETGKAKMCRLNKNTVPVLIDFWLQTDDLHAFYKAYKYCPLVLVTSAEVYHFLKQNRCPLNIKHWPLSLPDDEAKLKTSTLEIKKWDLVLIGRSDPYFINFLKRYCEEDTNFIYVDGNDNMNNRSFYTNKGDKVGEAKNRDQYFEMINSARIAFYSTPGVDASKLNNSKFNQVTPRFLELLAGGCYVFSNYKENEDTEYYEFDKMSKKINSYEDFRIALNACRNNKISVDLRKIHNYLKKHNTSSRVKLLKEILSSE